MAVARSITVSSSSDVDSTVIESSLSNILALGAALDPDDKHSIVFEPFGECNVDLTPRYASGGKSVTIAQPPPAHLAAAKTFVSAIRTVQQPGHGRDGEASTNELNSSESTVSIPSHAIHSKEWNRDFTTPTGENQDYVFGDPADFSAKLKENRTRAKIKSQWLDRPVGFPRVLQGLGYLFLLAVIYFVLVGWPLWHGVIYSFWFVYQEDLNLTAGAAIFVGLALIYAILPLLNYFEPAVETSMEFLNENHLKAQQTAVIIPCYRSGSIIGATLEAALKHFPAQNIFVIANGNSPKPLDETESVCKEYGVRHIWMPVGSKIAAQFAGCLAAHQFTYCLLIDDDVSLPKDFPIVTDRIEIGRRYGRRDALVKCIGYTLSASGPDGEPGSLCQQAQNLEYKFSGLMRTLFGRLGSAGFPHGAISLWEREFLVEAFRKHPGFTISEDWFFGWVCRRLGGRIQMCSQVFVKTEVPKNLVRSGESSRAGYGEMTVTKQRLLRWNFFLISRTWHNVLYILFSWRLRQYEIATKILVFQEVYNTLLLLSFPIIVPIAFGNNPAFAIPLTVGVILMYYVIIAIFNEVHLRRRNEQLPAKVVYLYYPGYKLWLRLVNVASIYVNIFRYARYFSTRHPKVADNEKILRALEDIMREDAARHTEPERNIYQ